ncbi:MAG: hypothetical protein KDA55_18715 [Planctomycetales bacterium]|nr:hypothetical protein [Planctomycetales bacterium]
MSPLLPQLFAATPLTDGHWGVVLLIATLFFIVQLVLCVRFMWRTGRYERAIRRLHADLVAGGDGRRGIDELGRRFEWLRWVDSSFPTGSKTPGNYTRDDVLQELDVRVASSSDYLLLQRMGVMAPLLGVMLTVLGFQWLEPPANEEQSFGEILQAVTPLVAGVGAGAVLAFINQALLHFAGNKTESLRMSARTWFDAAIWSSIGLDTQAATVKAITAIERMAETISASADQQHETTQHLATATNAIERAGNDFQQAVLTFSGNIGTLPETMAGLQKSTAAAAIALEQLIPVGKRAVAGLDVSVAAFRTAVDQEFTEAARLHHSAINGINDAVGALKSSTKSLQTDSQQLSESVRSHASSLVSVNSNLTADVLPAQQSLSGEVRSLIEQMAAFRQLVARMSTEVDAVAREFGSVAGRFEPAVGAFQSAVDERFVPAASRHAGSLNAISDTVDALHSASREVAEGSQSVARLLTEQTAASAEAGVAHTSLREASERIANVGSTLQQTLNDDVAPTQWALRAAAESFQESAGKLGDFLRDGLDPATQRLVELNDTLGQLRGTVDALAEFSQARENVEQLTQALSQASKIAEAVAALPEQLREIIEHQTEAGNSHGDAAARGSLLPWRRGR